MRGMLRRSALFVLIFAALLAIEPVLHSHSLQHASSNPSDSCAICAAGTARLPIVAPTVVAPQTVAYTVTATPISIVTVDVAIALSSRAPPAA